MIGQTFPSIEHSFPTINPTVASRRVKLVLAGQSLQPFRPAVSRRSLMPRRKGAKSEQPREVEVSKAMSLTLRHRAVRDGLKLDKNGYVNVADLVSLISCERLDHSSAIHSAQSLFRLNVSYNIYKVWLRSSLACMRTSPRIDLFSLRHRPNTKRSSWEANLCPCQAKQEIF